MNAVYNEDDGASIIDQQLEVIDDFGNVFFDWVREVKVIWKKFE